METIISSIITGTFATVVCVITQIASNSKTRALIEYRLMELEKKVEKHNEVLTRTFKLEEATAVQTEQIKVINHRIADLEEKSERKNK